MSPWKLHSSLADEIQNFIHLRRLSGTNYQSQAQLLGYFDRFLFEQQISGPPLTRKITDDYLLVLSHLAPRSRSNRFCVVRQLCQYLARNDPRGYVPEPLRVIPSQKAHSPYIYSPSQIQALLVAASKLPPANSLRPHTYRTLLGLLYSTGIRIGETLALNREDFQETEQRLYIAQGKFRKARWVPLSASTSQTLQQYLHKRLQVGSCSPDSPLFLNQRSCRLSPCTVNQTFRYLLEQCGICHSKLTGPRIHDLRHTFAVERLLAWYRDGQDVNARLPWLATYMGHVDIHSTQAYLQATPELIAQVDRRFYHHYLPTQKGLAVNTIMAYRDAIKLLLGYASDTLKKTVEQLCVEDIDESLVLGFLDHVENRRGCSPRSRNARLAAIRALFGFMAREEPSLLLHAQTIRTIPLKRTEHKTVDYLEEKEMQALLNAVDIDSRTGVRDKALLLLLYNTGARVSEIVQLKLPDLRLDGAAQVKLLGKGKKYRSCPLWPETLEALHDYLKQRTSKDPTAQQIFLNANGSPVTRFGLRYIVGKCAAKAKSQCPALAAKAVNPHTLRHTTAMHLLRAGNDINMVSYWLGHADINTTHTYLEIDMEMKRRMLEKTEAPAVKKPLPWQKPDVLQWLSALAKVPQSLCAVKY